MISEKKLAEQVVNYSSNISLNAGAGTYSNKVLYKYGRICVFSIIATFTDASADRHMATVPANCYPLARINLSCDRYGETSGGECYISSDGKIYVAITQTGDFKISGTWITV